MSFFLRTFFLAVAAVGHLIFVGESAHGSESSDPLLRLVPDDVTFCVVVEKPRDTLASISKGPFFEMVRKSPLGDAIRQIPELEQLRQFEKLLATQLEIDVTQVFENCFGDALVLAYQSGPHGRPELERGVIMSWVRDRKLLDAVLEKLNAAQRQSGELKEISELTYKGQKYFRRIKNKGADEYMILNGSVLAFSAQESMIHRVLERIGNVSGTPSGLVAQRLEKSGCRGATAAIWMNPRSFDAEIAIKSKESKGNEEAFLRPFHEFWLAIDGIVLGLHLQNHIEVSLALDLTPGKLSPAIQSVVLGDDAPSELWNSFPASAMLAVSGRTNFSNLMNLVGGMMSPEAKKALNASIVQSLGPVFGKKFIHQIPSLIGPDWGFCIARPADSKQLFPDVTAAMRVSDAKRDADAVQNLVTGVDSLATMFRLDYNGKHADQLTKKILRQNGEEVHFLEPESTWPSGLMPAYGLKSGYLVVASRPQLVSGFGSPKGADSQATQEFPLLRLSLRECRKYLRDRNEAIVELAKAGGKPADESISQLRNADLVLQFLDRFEIIQRPSSKGSLRLAARLHLAAPLRP